MNVYDAIDWINNEGKQLYPNYGITWGRKHVDGTETEDYSLIFHVPIKKSFESLSPDEILPDSIAINDIEYITDVKTKPVYKPLIYWCLADTSGTREPLRSNQIRHRPLIGGVEAESLWGQYVGTLGLMVRDISDGQVVTLSNSHVYAEGLLHAFARVQDKNIESILEYQPTGLYRTTPSNDLIGQCKRSIVIGNLDPHYTIDYTYNRSINSTSADAAISTITDYTTCLDTVNSVNVIGFNQVGPYQFASNTEIASLLDPVSPNYKSPIFRSGRTNGPVGYPGTSNSFGAGYSTTCSLSVTEIGTQYVGTYDTDALSYYQNTIAFAGNINAANGGDSGSALFALLSSNTPLPKWKCIGLLFAGTNSLPTVGIGCNINNIVRDLGIAPWNGVIPTHTSNRQTVPISNALSSTISLSGRTFYQTGSIINKGYTTPVTISPIA